MPAGAVSGPFGAGSGRGDAVTSLTLRSSAVGAAGVEAAAVVSSGRPGCLASACDFCSNDAGVGAGRVFATISRLDACSDGRFGAGCVAPTTLARVGATGATAMG